MASAVGWLSVFSAATPVGHKKLELPEESDVEEDFDQPGGRSEIVSNASVSSPTVNTGGAAVVGGAVNAGPFDDPEEPDEPQLADNSNTVPATTTRIRRPK